MRSQLVRTAYVLAFGVLVSFSFGSGQALAAGEHEGACRADAEKFCKNEKRGQIFKCMKDHEAELSAECKAQVTERREKVHENIKEAHEDCKADVEKFCKDIKPGGGRIIACLKHHQAELSPACSKHAPQGPKGSGKE